MARFMLIQRKARVPVCSQTTGEIRPLVIWKKWPPIPRNSSGLIESDSLLRGSKASILEVD